jgi:hypothetical protein|tara:strand:- start:44 stop:346 length:303 start_codon:yes stop_codon:yes gene_type:complete
VRFAAEVLGRLDFRKGASFDCLVLSKVLIIDRSSFDLTREITAVAVGHHNAEAVFKHEVLVIAHLWQNGHTQILTRFIDEIRGDSRRFESIIRGAVVIQL